MAQILKLLLGTTLLALILTPRLLALDTFSTADEKRWLANTSGFAMHLAHGEWGNLLQQPHPGVTTQWFGASTIFSDSTTVRKLPLVLWQCLLLGLVGYVFWRAWGSPAPAVLLVGLLAINPVLIAHTRVYAMDSLLAIWALLSLGLLLAARRTHSIAYLIAAGAATAAAALSKLPGLLLVPFTQLVLLYDLVHARTKHAVIVTTAWWWVAFIAAAVLILPSLAVNGSNVLDEFAGFFTSGDYQELHQEGRWYYLRTLAFFTTPIHWLALVLLLAGVSRTSWRRQFVPYVRQHGWGWLALFALLFLVQMSLGAKKGDRYLLPTLITLDALAAVIFSALYTVQLPPQRYRHIRAVGMALATLVLVTQTVHSLRLTPYTLAYVNPLTKPFFDSRRLGWGEGLDIAAAYLNQKAGAAELTVASYYPNEFAERFFGNTVPVHQHDAESVDYVVTYRAMFERGEAAWETDVLTQYRDRVPERVIYLNGLPYAWIYSRR